MYREPNAPAKGMPLGHWSIVQSPVRAFSILQGFLLRWCRIASAPCYLHLILWLYLLFPLPGQSPKSQFAHLIHLCCLSATLSLGTAFRRLPVALLGCRSVLDWGPLHSRPWNVGRLLNGDADKGLGPSCWHRSCRSKILVPEWALGRRQCPKGSTQTPVTRRKHAVSSLATRVAQQG